MSSFHPYLLDRRAGIARLAVWCVLALLVFSFFRTQILGHGKYQLQSETNRLRPIPLPAPRGLIYDRNGRVLAENLPGYTVSLLPGPEPVLRVMLEGKDQEEIRRWGQEIVDVVKTHLGS